MLRILSIFLLTFTSLLAHPHEGPEVEHSQAARDSLNKARSFTMVEGLPHPSTESEAYLAEAKRKDTQAIAGFQFYKPALKPIPGNTLRQLITNPANLTEWEQKRCAGFHPDWALTWRAGWRKQHALICFGCSELIFITREAQLRYNLTPTALKKLKAQLAPFQTKRPK